MRQPKFKLGDKVVWDGDEGVIDKVTFNDDPDAPCPIWYEVELGYTWVGCCEEDLTYASDHVS